MGSSSGGTEPKDSAAQATIAATRTPRSSVACLMIARARSGLRGRAEAAAKTEAMRSPTGVATAKPWFGPSSNTPGVGERVKSEEAGCGEERQ